MKLIQPCGRSDVGHAPLHLERGNMGAGWSRGVFRNSDSNSSREVTSSNYFLFTVFLSEHTFLKHQIC